VGNTFRKINMASTPTSVSGQLPMSRLSNPPRDIVGMAPPKLKSKGNVINISEVMSPITSFDLRQKMNRAVSRYVASVM
jgi:hypothetical protein